MLSRRVMSASKIHRSLGSSLSIASWRISRRGNSSSRLVSGSTPGGHCMSASKMFSGRCSLDATLRIFGWLSKAVAISRFRAIALSEQPVCPRHLEDVLPWDGHVRLALWEVADLSDRLDQEVDLLE